MTDVDFSGLEEPIAVSHDFVIELNYLVVLNHRFTLDAIKREEERELKDTFRAGSDPEYAESMQRDLERFYDDLRKAANSQAIVTVVTRFQHWISRLVKSIPGSPPKPKRSKKVPGSSTVPMDSRVVCELKHLNAYLGEGPVPTEFFAELVNVRDSVVHGDSWARWLDGKSKPRRVADCYATASGRTEIDDAQLTEAISKVTEQVEWYDAEIYARQGAGRAAK